MRTSYCLFALTLALLAQQLSMSQLTRERAGGGGSAFRLTVVPTDPETTLAVATQIRKSSTALSTVSPGGALHDLTPIGDAIGNARVVALGEATHGTREIFQMKHRLLEYLVTQKGFTVFAIEASWPDSSAVDRYIKTGEGDPKAVLSAMGYWTWQTEEVAAMLTWMRDFNMRRGKRPALSFTSFDMQVYEMARDGVIKFFREHAPQDCSAVETAYAPLAALNPNSLRDPEFGKAATDAEHVVSLLQSRADAFAKATSLRSFREALQMSRIVAQAAKWRADGRNPRYRDQLMAQNVHWLLNESYPGAKMVIWAHNGHVSKRGSGTMGSFLHQTLGSELYVLGFAIHTGTVRAMAQQAASTRLVEAKLPKADSGTGTAVLSAVGLPMYFLDMKTPAGILGKWLSVPHLFSGCDAFCRDNLSPDVLSQSYDGLIYLEDTNAARAIR